MNSNYFLKTFQKRIHVSVFLFFVSLALFAQIPKGYYDNAAGKKQAELKTVLCAIIRPHTVFSYGGASTWSCFAKSDVDSTGKCWDMYSSLRVSFNPDNSAIKGMNIEHSVPNSWWGHTQNDAYKDIFLLNPAEATANGWKGNFPMGYVTTVNHTNGVIKVGTGTPDGLTTSMNLWEPADRYKGDFARQYMYMVTCYEEMASMWMGTGLTTFSKTTYPTFLDWFRDLLLKWDRQDPIDKKEIDRNNAIYASQHNRNPYIDFPGLAEYVWGNKITVPFTITVSVDFPYLSTPSNGLIVDFGKISYNQPAKADTLLLKAVNLTGDLSVQISGNNATDFTVNSTLISKADAEAGFKLIINCTPMNVGTESAQITLSGGGTTSPSFVNLKASSTDNFQAFPSENVTQTGFDANWSFSANSTGYTVNVYSLHNDGLVQKVTLLENDFPNGLPSGWTTSGWTDNTVAGSVKLASGSNVGKLIFPALNLSTAGYSLTVRARQYNNDGGAPLTATIDGQPLSVWTTAVANQDFTVSLPYLTATSVITLSAGASSRVLIDYVKVESQGSSLTPVSVHGYPKSVGNILTYSVTGLTSDSTFYFNIQPLGNSAAISNTIKVHTLVVTGIEQENKNTVNWHVTTQGIHISNLSAGCSVNVMDMMGRKVISKKATDSEVQLPIPQRGIYFLQVQNGGYSRSYKFAY